MNAYKYIKENIRKNLKPKLIEWRRANAIEKIDKPTDIGRARNLGYKDKKGFIIARVRLKRGGRKRKKPEKGRKSTKQTLRKTLKMSYRGVAEYRAQKKFTNLEVLNSYLAGQDGVHYFFEVILVDPERPEIKSDPGISWICKPKNRKRALRGLTSAGKKSRGLRA